MESFVIIGNSWDASRDNPTSKHQVALTLGRVGHKVLWVDGAGMRTPRLSSGGDRSKITARLRAALRPVEKVAENIWRIAPLILPFPGSSTARRINERIYLGAIRRAARKLDLAGAILMNFLPTIPGVQAKWCGKTIYYCVDRWGQFAGHDSELMETLNTQCCRNADLVIASAQDLYERCRRHNENCYLIPHGVDHAHFARGGGAGGACETIDHRPQTEDGRLKTEDGGRWTEVGRQGDGEGRKIDRRLQTADCRLKTVRRERIRLWRKDRGQRSEDGGVEVDHRQGEEEGQISNQHSSSRRHEPATSNLTTSPNDSTTQQLNNLATADTAPRRRIGFFGLIDERMDIDLMIALAEKIGDCELVLAGKADGNADRLKRVQNIRLPGSVPYSDLPELIATFDVCIIPYKVNELTKAINPIKLREMLAAGCPVVSTALPEVEKLAREMPEGAVMVAGSNDEFIECVRRILDKPPTLEARKRISESVKDQDWSAKVDEILELLNRSRE